MPDPTLDPRSEKLLDERVGRARAALHDAVGDVDAPAFGDLRTRRDHRRMSAAAAAIAVVLAGSLAALATDDEGAVSTIDAPATTSESSTTTTAPPSTTSTTAVAPAPEATTTTTAPPTTSPPSTTTTTAPLVEEPSARLRNKTFAGSMVTQAGEPRPLVEGTEIEVTFHDRDDAGDHVGWSAGCNGYGSSVAITADRLDVGDDIASSAAGCDRAHGEQDRWLQEFFQADPHWMLERNTLTLTVDDTVITLAERL